MYNACFSTQKANRPVQKSRQQALRAYCSNIYTVISGQPKPVLKKTKPIVQYSSNCHLCKMSSVVPKVQGKPWRKHSFIDINRNELGVMITRDKNDFSVHQACMDYAHGKCLLIVGILLKSFLTCSCRFYIPNHWFQLVFLLF